MCHQKPTQEKTNKRQNVSLNLFTAMKTPTLKENTSLLMVDLAVGAINHKSKKSFWSDFRLVFQ